METNDIKKLITTTDYDFLRTNEHLGDRIVFLTLGGSHAYGTNVEGSDVDIRGCSLNSKSDLLGLSNFEQFVNEETDTTIYGFNKLIGLICNCNPNTIELLGCKPEHYFLMTNIGEELLANKGLFLSKRAIYSFGGYANQQLSRLTNALAHDAMPQDEKEEHIRRSMENALRAFQTKYEHDEYGSISLFTGDSKKKNMSKEILANIHLDGFPVRDFHGMLNELSSIVGIYDKLNHRNTKKDAAHLNKHAMHLVRLYLMCFDILEKKEINTYRELDRDFLLSIRNGCFMAADGSFRQEFFDLIDGYQKRLDYDKENTDLPDKPNMKVIEELVEDVNRRALCLV